MLNSYFKIALRNLWQHKLYTLLNLTGFSAGIISVLLLFFYIQDELMVDSFSKDKDKIYRVIRLSEINNEPYKIGITSGPFARALKNDFPEISKVTRVMPDEGLIVYGEKRILEKKFFYADANFFAFFSIPLLSGNPEKVLNASNAVVLTQATADRYFGKENPIGKILKLDNNQSLVVTGVCGPTPARSHLDFDFIATIDLLEKQEWFKDWWSNSLCTYVQVNTPEQASYLNKMFPKFMDKYFGKDFIANNNRIDLALQPLNEVYFDYTTRYDPVRHGNLTTVYILGAVGLAILVIACFNYINLAIAFSFRRAKEVGIRKVLGSFRQALLLQFLVESTVLVLFAVLAACLLSELLLPWFNYFFSLQVNLIWFSVESLGFLLLLLLATATLSGVYPAFLISGFSPLKALKGKIKITGSGIWSRRMLVTCQFGISVFMMIVMLLMVFQFHFLKKSDLGFKKEAVVLLETPSVIRQKMKAFKEAISQHPAILHFSAGSGAPGGFHDATSVDVDGKDSNFRLRVGFIDEDYVETYGLKIIAGRDFDKKYPSDSLHSILLNETAVKKLGWKAEEALGRQVHLELFDSLPRRVVGVIKDYHFASMKETIEPLALSKTRRNWLVGIRVNPDQIKPALSHIEHSWKKFASEYPFGYRFLDESFFRLYENELKQEKVFYVFARLSIFLACLGIFGLASFSTEQRKKEIGIRKVLGASVMNILQLISKDFFTLVIAGILLACPAAYYFASQWLQNFAYRIELHWLIFVLAALPAVLVALFTISLQIFKVTSVNPVEVLKNE